MAFRPVTVTARGPAWSRNQTISGMTGRDPILARGRYLVREASGTADLKAALDLRARAFGTAGQETDAFDETCVHLLMEDVQAAATVCCFRLALLHTPADLEHSYCARYHDLGALLERGGPVLELGRFCIDPDRRDPDILRMAWAALTRLVDETGARMLIGCASFAGTDPDSYRDAFALLASRHLAPLSWRPLTRDIDAIAYVERYRQPPDQARALIQMPPLLRSYLAMGGRVGDHAVVDPALNTLHVFTVLEIAAIPDARKRLLRALLK